MSIHTRPVVEGLDYYDTYPEFVAALRRPVSYGLDGATLAVTFDPDLSAAEVTTFDSFFVLRETLARQAVPMNAATYATVRPQIQALRDLRQMGRNAFMNLTAAERDRLLYDAQTSTTIILLALLRE
jgi:hypothetical protein